MDNLHFLQRTLGDLVTDDFRFAAIFAKSGLDFCCGGNKLLKDACIEKNINENLLVQQLLKASEDPSLPGQNFKDWPLDFLCDYIVNTHHKFVRDNLADLDHYTQKIASVHGSNHTELHQVAGLFGQLSAELYQHMGKEEEILFPAVKQMLREDNTKSRALIRSEIERMSGEHEFAGGAMDKINNLTYAYTLPPDACNTYKITFKLLERFENDLHVHVHLENNILFPKALTL